MSFHIAAKRSTYGLPVFPSFGRYATGIVAAAGAGVTAGAGPCVTAGGAALFSSRTIGVSTAGFGSCAPADCALGSTQDPEIQTATAATAAIAALVRPFVIPSLLADELQVVDE